MRIPLLFAALLSLACGRDGSILDGASSTAQAIEDVGWIDALPADFADVAIVDSQRVHGCMFTVGTAIVPSQFTPPTYYVWLQKAPARAGASCEDTGYIVLGSSTTLPSVELGTARGRGFVVVAFTQKTTFSGAGFSHLEIVEVSSSDGSILHHVALAALPPVGTGTVDVTDVTIRGSGTLIVEGTKNGVIPGETGSGSSYVATWERFATNEEFSPTPTSVVASQ